MDARRFLQDVGNSVSSDFAKNRTLLRFEEYLLGIAENASGVDLARPLAASEVWMVVTQPNTVRVNPIGSDFSVVA